MPEGVVRLLVCHLLCKQGIVGPSRAPDSFSNGDKPFTLCTCVALDLMLEDSSMGREGSTNRERPVVPRVDHTDPPVPLVLHLPHNCVHSTEVRSQSIAQFIHTYLQQSGWQICRGCVAEGDAFTNPSTSYGLSRQNSHLALSASQQMKGNDVSTPIQPGSTPDVRSLFKTSCKSTTHEPVAKCMYIIDSPSRGGFDNILSHLRRLARYSKATPNE
eukprot:4218638-Pyramimonas_sp.AAC.1